MSYMCSPRPWVLPFLFLVFLVPLAVLPCIAQPAASNLLTRGGAAPVLSAIAPPTARERSILVQSFATEKLWNWQKRLNLEDWKIAVEVSRAGELKPRTLGNIHWDTDKKVATIHVLDPADYHLPFTAVLDDIEFTVVHELIHLELAPVLSPLQRNDANRREEEHAVNHMTEALLHLDRGR